MQLDIFSAGEAQAVDLRQTKLPELSEAVARVGEVSHWATLTLSEVLELWYQLYSDFVEVLDGPIDHARSFCKENGAHYGEGGPMARKFYQREYDRLLRGQQQLRATLQNQYCDNLIEAFEQGKAVLRAEGMSEDDTEASGEFFNQVIQRPNPADLVKPLPTLMRDVALEYLKLQE